MKQDIDFNTNLLNSCGDEMVMYSIYEINQVNKRDSREFVFTLRYNFDSAKSKYKGTGAGEAQKSRM